MAQDSNKKITSWLKKLEQESWQLELLVSAFTIFLLIQAIDEYSEAGMTKKMDTYAQVPFWIE